MPRRYILTASERAGLVAIPTDETELIRLYTLSEQDLSVIKQRRGDANRLGFAVLLCCLRYPGYALAAGEDPPHTFLAMLSAQLGVEPEIWAEYAGREETRREHLSELRTLLGLRPVGLKVSPFRSLADGSGVADRQGCCSSDFANSASP